MFFEKKRYNDALKCFEKALEIAEKFESELIVMTVIQSEISDSTGLSLQRMEEIQDEQEHTAKTMLKKLETRVKTKNVSFSVKVVYNPSSSDGIVTFADNNMLISPNGFRSRIGQRAREGIDTGCEPVGY